MAAFTVSITPNRPQAMYAVNQEIRFTVRVLYGEQPVTYGVATYLIDTGTPESRRFGTSTLGAEPLVLATALGEPGIVRCYVTYTLGNGQVIDGLAVVGVALEQLQPSQPPPADFDAYWQGEKAKLAKLPMAATTRPVPTAIPQVACEDVAIAFQPGKPVYGYLSKPVGAAPRSLPAILWLPFAGVGGAFQYQSVRGAEMGALSLSINIFGLQNGLAQEAYDPLSEGMLKQYPLQGREHRDRYFFHDAYLMVWRALDYLAAQPEWNGKVLAAFGSSQGGALALVAGYDPRVTLVAAAVPAMADHAALTVNRMEPWPQIIIRNDDGTFDTQTMTTAGYYDAVNFARRCRARTLFSVGFLDTVSPPTSVYAAYNQLPGEKSMLNAWQGRHDCPPEFEPLFFRALSAQRP